MVGMDKRGTKSNGKDMDSSGLQRGPRTLLPKVYLPFPYQLLLRDEAQGQVSC